jgi:hypothetical protein
MEEVENSGLQGWAAIYGKELNTEEIREIEVNIQKMAEVLIEIEGCNH